MTPAEIIEGTLELLNSPERWCKDLLYNDLDGSYCLVGALSQVAAQDWRLAWMWPEDSPADEAIIALHALATEKGYANVVYFNNAPETEYEDIRLFLKEALERVA